MDLKNLIDGRAYTLNARGMQVGVWDAATGMFTGLVYKFGGLHLQQEKHWDLDPKYGTAKALSLVGDVPRDNENIEEFLRRLDARAHGQTRA